MLRLGFCHARSSISAPCRSWSTVARSTASAANATSCTVMGITDTSVKEAINFLTLVQSLKISKRTGWIRKGIAGPESIADHMYRMSLMALIAGDATVDTTRCIKLAIVHDVAEAIVGDIAPGDGVSKEEKNKLETEAMEEIRRTLGYNTRAGAEVQELWQEYEDNATVEAKLVKDFDKLEMTLQAQEYEAAQGADLQEFFDSTKGRFQTVLGKAWAAEIASRRSQGASAEATA